MQADSNHSIFPVALLFVDILFAQCVKTSISHADKYYLLVNPKLLLVRSSMKRCGNETKNNEFGIQAVYM